MSVQASVHAHVYVYFAVCWRGGLQQGIRGDNVAAATARQQRRFFDNAATTVQWHGVMIMARRQSTVDNVAAKRGDENEDIDSNAAMKAKMMTETTVSQRYLRRRLSTTTKTKIKAATASVPTPMAMASATTDGGSIEAADSDNGVATECQE